MNDLVHLKLAKHLTYEEIAGQIKERTGRTYSPAYLGNVYRGVVPLSDSLRLNLHVAFPDFVLLTGTQNSVKSHNTTGGAS